MASQVTIRMRRSAAERHALVQVERAIRSSDSHTRRKYIREYAEAFPSYESVLTPAQLQNALLSSGVVLIGDYHALPASQRLACALLEQLEAARARPVVLGLETVFSRDQAALDEWMRGEVDEAELRDRIRFDLDWGYDWQPLLALLESARRHAAGLYGLDCMPRDDLRRISARDRHAAAKLAEIRARHPDAIVLVLFGESHLAPSHLPAEVRSRLPGERVFTVLQNVDALYWQATGERRERVEAVRVAPDVACVFTATPLEKYESYRLCIERWRQDTAPPDFAPTFYNLVDALLRFFNIDRYSPQTGARAQFLVDLLPAVSARSGNDEVRSRMLRTGASESGVREALDRLAERGSFYVPALNTLFVRNFQLAHGSEDAARFLHHACSGSLAVRTAAGDLGPEDTFYVRTMEHALADFAARVLYPARPIVREQDLYALYTQTREAVEEQGICTYREYMHVADFLVMHKDYESNLSAYLDVPPLMREGVLLPGARGRFAAEMLGKLLGSQLYSAYVAGRVRKRFLRSLYCRALHQPGAARTAYFVAVRRTRMPKKKVLAA
ncbi:MAG TPA: ChaN family lipoprotein [Terriglobales bacterium]|nr:ChaN family lipoprotein [Terriglobales bacterium]